MLEINLTKNTNEVLNGTLGKYYGRVEYKGTLGVKDLAKIMKKHTTAFSLGEITGMLLDLASLIKEYALMGYVVKIDDLGLFKASIDANGLTLEEGHAGYGRDYYCQYERRGAVAVHLEDQGADQAADGKCSV